MESSSFELRSLAVFRTTSGDALSVLDDWRSDPDEQHEPGHLFLAELVQSLYDERAFNVILTPEFPSSMPITTTTFTSISLPASGS